MLDLRIVQTGQEGLNIDNDNETKSVSFIYEFRVHSCFRCVNEIDRITRDADN